MKNLGFQMKRIIFFIILVFSYLFMNTCYAYNINVKSDRTDWEYIENLEKLSRLGDVKSTIILSLYYMEGLGVSKNHEKSFNLILNASKMKILDKNQEIYIYEILGSMYLHGNGIAKNGEKAFEWFSKSANLGSGRSLSTLGVMYFNGDGVKKDLKKAVQFFEKSASEGDSTAILNLGNIYFKDKNYKEALKWYEKSDNLQLSQYRLGIIYFNGYGVEKDFEKSANYFRKTFFYNKNGKNYDDKLSRFSMELLNEMYENKKIKSIFSDENNIHVKKISNNKNMISIIKGFDPDKVVSFVDDVPDSVVDTLMSEHTVNFISFFSSASDSINKEINNMRDIDRIINDIFNLSKIKQSNNIYYVNSIVGNIDFSFITKYNEKYFAYFFNEVNDSNKKDLSFIVGIVNGANSSGIASSVDGSKGSTCLYIAYALLTGINKDKHIKSDIGRAFEWLKACHVYFKGANRQVNYLLASAYESMNPYKYKEYIINLYENALLSDFDGYKGNNSDVLYRLGMVYKNENYFKYIEYITKSWIKGHPLASYEIKLFYIVLSLFIFIVIPFVSILSLYVYNKKFNYIIIKFKDVNESELESFKYYIKNSYYEYYCDGYISKKAEIKCNKDGVLYVKLLFPIKSKIDTVAKILNKIFEAVRNRQYGVYVTSLTVNNKGRIPNPILLDSITIEKDIDTILDNFYKKPLLISSN